MDILKYKKIEVGFIPWSPIYFEVAKLASEFISTEKFNVLHIGSTSFKVGGKGIIDLSILYGNGELTSAVDHLHALGFQDQVSDNPFPPERPRKDGAVIVGGEIYILHVHVIENDSDEHIKQIKYKNYMLDNPEARKEYELSKKNI